MPPGLCPVAFHSRHCPQGIALSWAGRSIAWDAFNNYVHSTSRYLKEISVRAEAHILVVKEDSPAYVIVLLALWRIGAVPCPVDPEILSEKAAFINAAVKPCLVISARGLKKTWGQKGRWADIEQVVAYGYNDSFLGSEAALDPQIDSDHAALLRLEISGDAVETRVLTHEQLKKDPGDMEPLLNALVTGQPYNI
jgi:acyl-CoA synthetase (AMP-forming)/AMP-acid ligase II